MKFAHALEPFFTLHDAFQPGEKVFVKLDKTEKKTGSRWTVRDLVYIYVGITATGKAIIQHLITGEQTMMMIGRMRKYNG